MNKETLTNSLHPDPESDCRLDPKTYKGFEILHPLSLYKVSNLVGTVGQSRGVESHPLGLLRDNLAQVRLQPIQLLD